MWKSKRQSLSQASNLSSEVEGQYKKDSEEVVRTSRIEDKLRLSQCIKFNLWN